ncbi:MAG: hypothetical protein KGY69_06325 [Bacteroidales bacterium]|nr:hypothetical protein [Bacteroidales bacterium]
MKETDNKPCPPEQEIQNKKTATLPDVSCFKYNYQVLLVYCVSFFEPIQSSNLNPNYSRIILTLLKNLAFCFKKFRKKPVFLMRGYLHPSRKPSRIQKLHYPAEEAG